MTTFATNTIPFNTNTYPNCGTNFGACPTGCYTPVFNGYGWQYIPSGFQNHPWNNTFNTAQYFPQNTYPYWNAQSFGNTWQNCATPMNTYPAYAYQPSPWMNAWNSQYGFGGNQFAFPYGMNAWNTTTQFNQYPVNAQCPTNSWCNPFTQNCGNGCTTGTPCNTYVPNTFSQYTPWNANCGFPFSGFQPFNACPTPNTNTWYGNSAFTYPHAQAYPYFNNWQHPFSTPFNTSPWYGCAPTGYPTHTGTPVPGAVYPTGSPITQNGQPNPCAYGRPMENGDMGYNLQRNAA